MWKSLGGSTVFEENSLPLMSRRIDRHFEYDQKENMAHSGEERSEEDAKKVCYLPEGYEEAYGTERSTTSTSESQRVRTF